tara:strand:- start:14007 stop:14219 length:213 start_codon:yes stop_codon:yes gene_type:complete
MDVKYPNITNNRQRIKFGLEPLDYVDRLKGIEGYDNLSNNVKLFLVEMAIKADALDGFIGKIESKKQVEA